MKRWLVNLTLGVYLSCFAGGLVLHAMSMNHLTTFNTAIYFFVWDMFSGWSNYERRIYVVSEGVSGKYYELDPAPWGEMHPFGTIGRRHYDASGAYAVKFGLNTLRYTKHEPMSRVFVVEEFFSKKYNLNETLWNKYFNEPKQPTYYRNTMFVVLPDGTPVDTRECWLTAQQNRTVAANPRVIEESQRAQPFVAVDKPVGQVQQQLPFMDPTMSRALGQ